jgi:AGZA family xanthine/uracil permease-like MFS transporter
MLAHGKQDSHTTRDASRQEPRIAIPSFLTIVMIPLTYSIATGLSFGMISFASLEPATGRARREHWMLYLLATLFLLRFIYIR